MLTAFDVLLIGIAIIIMLAGFAKRWSAWRIGQDEDRDGDWPGLIGYIMGHRKILEDRQAGVAHLILFWGFGIPLIIVILAQFRFIMPLMIARCLSLLTDILGIAMLLGILFFLTRRIKNSGLRAPKRAVLPLVVLLVILLTGFLAEGAHLNIVHPKFSWSSPVGWLFSVGLPASSPFMQMMIRFHFFAVLFFVASLPFTSMRHIVAAPLNAYYRKQGPYGELKPISLEEGPFGARSVVDLSWKQLLDAEACISCGRCEQNCPAFISGKPLSPNKVMLDILEQMEKVNRRRTMSGNPSFPLLEDAITSDEIWSCTTCMACVEHCPVFIEPVDKIIDMRRYLVLDKSCFPPELQTLFENLEIYGDTFGKGIAKRKGMASNLGIKTASESKKIDCLLWVGCQASFHDRAKDSLLALVRILKNLGIETTILEKKEFCCGDPARRLGNEYLFYELARKNIERLKEYQVKKILTLCPHCYNTLKNDYPKLGGSFDVIHYAQLLRDQISTGKLRMKSLSQFKATFQDPCYLSRVNSMSELPRMILRSIPDLEILEMKRTKEKGLCCGAGGGGLWLHEHLGRRINEVRAEEACATGADLLITACPYCLVMLDDGVKSLDPQANIDVKELSELVEENMHK